MMNKLRGTTLIEMIIVVACFSVIAVATYGLVNQTNLANDHLNAWNKLTQWGQKSIDEINFELAQARLVYQNDSLGTTYLTRLQNDASYPILGNSLLPVVDPTGTFRQDVAGVTRTGNSILFVKEATPFIADAGGVTRRVNVYYMVYYYLSPVTATIGSKTSSLRLIRWQSREFADADQVLSISSPISRHAFADALRDSPRNITYLWNPHNTPSTAFYVLDDDEIDDADDDEIEDTQPSLYTIQKSAAKPVSGALGTSFASVAWNRADDFWVFDVVPKFAVASSVGQGFPHGFEVQVIGPTGARQILVRLVLVYFVNLDRTLFSTEATTIATMHEY